MRLLHPTLYLWLIHIARSLKVFLLVLLNSIFVGKGCRESSDRDALLILP
jgi:hypothetical protein